MPPSTPASHDDDAPAGPAGPNGSAVAAPKPKPDIRQLPDVRLTLAMFQRAVHAVTHELFQLAHEWEDPLLQRRYSYTDQPVPGESGTGWPKLPRHAVSLPKGEAFSSAKVGRVVERAHSFFRSQMPFLARLSRAPRAMFADVGHDAFRAFFDEPDIFPMPSTLVSADVAFWTSDACFADQFLNGCNPTVIERVTSMQHVETVMPPELRALTDPSGRTVAQLVADGSLLVADYAMLAQAGLYERVDATHGSFTNEIRFDAVGLPSTMQKHFYAPYVAFHRTEGGTLGVLGIVLTRFTDRANAVYNAQTCARCPNIYTFAKMHVACADNQTHQFFYHLGRCHLAYEPFGVAARNVFELGGSAAAQTHVVGRLLRPHFRDHIAINWLARNTLIASGPDAIPFTDAGFALGARGGLAFMVSKYASWKFGEQAFPAQLRSRGFDPDAADDGLQYHYRDDGLRVWGALRRYVRAALVDFYGAGGDAAVASDDVLFAWCTEMRSRDRAAVPSFPAAFDGVDELATAVTTIIYNVSAEHSAVNFAQERYLSYVPNRPNALFRPVPAPSDSDMGLVREVLALRRGSGDDNDVGASMPLAFAFFQVSFAHLLTTRPTHTLIELDVPGIPVRVTAELRRELVELHERIAARNARLQREDPTRAPYEFLDPVQIAQSIEI